MSEESERPFQEFKKKFSNYNFTNFFIKYLGLDPDWIRVPSNRLDPDPDSAKYLDQCIRIRNTAKNASTPLSSTQLPKIHCLPSLFVIPFLAPYNSIPVTPA